MRIAHITDCYLPRLGGIEMQVRDLAHRQSAEGHEVTIVTSTRGPEGVNSDSTALVRVDPSTRQPGRIMYRRSARGRRAIEGSRFDVLHVHASAFSPLAFLAAHRAGRLGIPTVVTVHSLWARATWSFKLANHLTGWADWPVVWTAVSDVAATGLRQIVRDEVPVSVIPNGVDPQAWRVEPLAGDESKLRVVAVGRLAPRKRPLQMAKMLLDTQRRLAPGTELSAEIIGDGPERARLERFLHHHQMTGWVRLRGALDRKEIGQALARSDVFVAPATLESFGIAALEARSAGLPILARTGTGTGDFVRHGVEGWLVDSDRAMADTLAALASDRKRVETVSIHNRSVPPSIDWPLVLDLCEEAYDQARGWQRVSAVAGGMAGPATSR